MYISGLGCLFDTQEPRRGEVTAFAPGFCHRCLIMEKVRKFCYKGEFFDVNVGSSKTVRECVREFLRVMSMGTSDLLEIPQAHF